MKPKKLYFDIETSFCLAGVYKTGDQYVSEEQLLDHTRIICIGYMWEGDKKPTVLKWDNKKDDKKLLKTFAKLMDKADVVIGHNMKKFDFQVVLARIAYHKLPPIADTLVSDTYRMVKNSMKLPSYKLSYLVRYFKIGLKMRTGGFGLWYDVVVSNDRKQLEYMAKYCAMDVKITKALYARILPYVKDPLNLSSYLGKQCCPSCGGTVHKHGIALVSKLKKVQRFRCISCGKVSQSGINLLTGTKNILR